MGCLLSVFILPWLPVQRSSRSVACSSTGQPDQWTSLLPGLWCTRQGCSSGSLFLGFNEGFPGSLRLRVCRFCLRFCPFLDTRKGVYIKGPSYSVPASSCRFVLPPRCSLLLGFEAAEQQAVGGAHGFAARLGVMNPQSLSCCALFGSFFSFFSFLSSSPLLFPSFFAYLFRQHVAYL